MTDLTGSTDSVRLIRPTAGQLDVWSRVAGLGVPVGLVAGLGISMALGFTGVPSTVLLAILVIGPALVSTFLGIRTVSVAKLERAEGYSTMFDFAGFQLRDPRTLEVVRDRDIRPSGTMRRSLFRSMLTVKQGTLLAKRLDEDDEHDR